MAVFWVLAPYTMVWVYQRFRGLYRLHHQGDEWSRAREIGRDKVDKSDNAELGRTYGKGRYQARAKETVGVEGGVTAGWWGNV
jgi:hypothetical protein